VFAEDAQPSKVELPAVKIGDSWTYDNVDAWKNVKEFTSVTVVTALTDADIRTEAKRTDNGEITTTVLGRDFNRLSRETGGRKGIWDPYYPIYSFPLEVGKSWEKEVTYTRNYDSFKVVMKAKGQVVGWEKVSVPAGTFNALKIEVSGPFNGFNPAPGGGRWSGQQFLTVWYVPEVRNSVKAIYEDRNEYRSVTKVSVELVEYKLAQ